MAVNQLNDSLPIVDSEGKMTRRMSDFAQDVSLLAIFVGDGSPEGVIESGEAREYMDRLGVTGSIKYIKRNADIDGDRTRGWVAV